MVRHKREDTRRSRLADNEWKRFCENRRHNADVSEWQQVLHLHMGQPEGHVGPRRDERLKVSRKVSDAQDQKAAAAENA